MKTIFLFILAAIILFSCEKDTDTKLDTDTPALILENQILNDEVVMAIDFGVNDAVWIATNTPELIKYKNGTKIKFNTQNSNMPLCERIWDIAVDKNNEVWMGTSIGLLHFNGNNFNLYNTSNSIMPIDFVSNVEVDSENRIWFASARANEGNLMLLDNQSMQKVMVPQINDKIIHDIKIDAESNVFIATGTYINNCKIYKLGNQTRGNYQVHEINGSFYYFGEIELGRKGEVFVSVNYSLSSTYIQNQPTILKCFGDDVENLNPFSEYSGICNIQVDMFGNLWTTYVENNKGYIGYYSDTEWNLKEMEFANRWITCMKADKKGKMWFGTENGVYIVK